MPVVSCQGYSRSRSWVAGAVAGFAASNMTGLSDGAGGVAAGVSAVRETMDRRLPLTLRGHRGDNLRRDA